MKVKRTAGRPKMAEKYKKVRFSVTLKPSLIESIDNKITPEKGRNTLIEETLTEKFKPKKP